MILLLLGEKAGMREGVKHCSNIIHSALQDPWLNLAIGNGG
jgi:hypothetical protein